MKTKMTDYEKLKQIIDDIQELIVSRVTCYSPSFQAWKTEAERFLIRKYGKENIEHQKFLQTGFSIRGIVRSVPESEQIAACEHGLRISEAIFKTYLEEMEEKDVNTTTSASLQLSDYERVFIVHGHDGELKQSVARILEKQTIIPIILSEQTNQGQTIIEKIESNSGVGAAICLFTADDLGKSKGNKKNALRARQNVVFETGFFLGRLGRSRIVILADQGVEIPSDLSGVVYTNTTNWQFDLLKEMKTMGYTVDMNKLL